MYDKCKPTLMKTTIYLQDELARQAQEYLEIHPTETMSSLVQEALKAKIARVEGAAALLKLAGIVQNAEPEDSQTWCE